MKTIELQLPDHVYHRAESLAASRSCSLDRLLPFFVQRAVDEQAPPDETMGLFADAPELLDHVVAEALAEREQRWAPTDE